MAEYIKRDAALKALLQVSAPTPSESHIVEKCIEKINRLPMMEVVRCKDCKHKTVTSDGMVCECALPTKRMQDYYIYGSTILARVEPDAFCSYGERREGE